MVYDKDLCGGVKRKSIPSARLFDLNTSTSFPELVELTKAVFFKDEDSSLSNFALAASSGFPFEISDDWELGKFMNKHSYKPSKLKLYLMLKQEPIASISTDDCSDD